MATAAPDSAPVILVIDDEPAVLRMTERMLLDGGYAVHCLPSAAEAIKLLDAFTVSPAAVVTDLRMEPIDGLALAGLLRKHWPNTPVLFVSGFGAPEQIENLPGPLLTKPFREEHLLEAVAQLLPQHHRVQLSS